MSHLDRGSIDKQWDWLNGLKWMSSFYMVGGLEITEVLWNYSYVLGVINKDRVCFPVAHEHRHRLILNTRPWKQNLTFIFSVCPRLQLPPNGYVSNYYDSPLFDYLPRAENIEGTSVDINCSNHHTLFGQSRFQCLTGGVWDIDAMPECIKGKDVFL